MTTFLISVLAALGVVLIIAVTGIILAKIFINKANKAQIQANTIFEQSQAASAVVVDIDDLSEARQQPSITVISNDAIEGSPHHHHHQNLNKKTISVVNQDAQIDHINDKNTTIEKDLATSDHNVISSNTSIVNPLTDKITLDY